jgi:hypothetical protein
MAAAEEMGRESREQRPARRSAPSAATTATPSASANAAEKKRAAATRRRQVARVDCPAVAPCPDLDDLRALSAEAARTHVDAYLHEVMPARQADDFEARSFRWELHLVKLDQLCLLRRVDLSKRKLGRYRAVLRRHGGFPPLIGLGGDGHDATRGVLLCDGYHRAVAMRDVDLHFAWMWLAVGPWAEAPEATKLALSRES